MQAFHPVTSLPDSKQNDQILHKMHQQQWMSTHAELLLK